MSLVLLKGGYVVTQNRNREHFVGDILVKKNRIEAIARHLDAPSGAEVIDVKNHFVIPGLIQTHTHVCQTLFRGLADDLSLLDWLKKRIWPLEAAHDEASLLAAARLGILEMQLLGTTSILDMGTVHHTDSIFAAAEEAGLRYWGGKCLMDAKKYSGPLYEPTASALESTEKLIKRWHKKTDLLNYALCPRFAISCTEELLSACVELQKKYGLIIHTHASENLDEIRLVKKLTGLRNIDYFAKLRLLGSRTVIAHGIHLSDAELSKVAKSKTAIAHCPSSNLKLASGIAQIQKYLKKKVRIGLGNDGAPCNNTMDPFAELRLAALLQKPANGPKALPANIAFDLATRGGAESLGMLGEIGSIETGKLADLVTVSREHPSVATISDPYSALVYSATGRDVTNVMINGRIVIKNRSHTLLNTERVVSQAQQELAKLRARTKV